MDGIDLKGRVAVVTGASRGIGAATARRLARAGADLVLAARSTGPLEDVAAELAAIGVTAVAVPADLRRGEDLDRVIAEVGDRFGHVDILINNAGVLPPAARLERVTRSDWDAAIELNLTAPWYLATRLFPLMSAGAAVVNVASPASFFPSVGLSTYNITKSALTMLTRSCGLEWARSGVRVNTVVPGKIDTEMVAPILAFIEKNQLSINPLGRIGAADEVAEAIAFLVSDHASYITGAVLAVDGGELITAPA